MALLSKITTIITLWLAVSFHVAKEGDGKPNIVLIFSDDVGWTGLACFGSKYYETPNIDKLAGGGMKFTNGYAPAPVCAPSRAALLSGQYGSRNGTLRVSDVPKRINKPWLYKSIQPKNLPFPEDITTMAEALQHAGYATGMFGKWHLGPGKPGDHGFEKWIMSQGKHFNFRTTPEMDVPDGIYLTDFMANHAIGFIRENKDRPFFLYLPDFLVHKPHEAKPELIEKYKNKKPVDGHKDPVYAAMTESLDFTVGRIYNTLDSLGLLENTLIIFTSDNGAMARTNPDGTLKKNSFTSNLPLRDGKGLMYEGGIRVPFIFYWKGKIKAGMVNDTPITALDLYPTFLDVAGIAPPAGQVLDGESILKCLLEPDYKMPERPLFWHYPNYGPASLKKGKVNYAYIPTDVLRLGDYKLLEFYHDTVDHVELYNLKEDIGERNDLSKKMPKKVEELQTILHRIRRESNARMPIPNPEYDPGHQE